MDKGTAIMSKITLKDAQTILEAAVAHGAEIETKPLTIAVLDSGGHLKAFWRQDGSPTLRPQVAIGKAKTCVGLGMPSRKAGEGAQDRPVFFGALSTLAEGNVVPAAGGVPVLDSDDDIIGAVGISGDLSDRDEACAIAGVEAAGFKAGT